MSRVSNTINSSDRSTTPIKLRYTSSYNQCIFDEYGISVLNGVNGPVSITGSVSQTTLNYYSVKQLYYSNFLTGSFLSNSSSFDNFLQSTAASGTFDADVRYFPTESNSQIRVLSIPRTIFGENVGRNGLIISSSAYYIMDDGNGNVLDYSTSPKTHVGNVLYNQGIVVITNQNYLNVFPYYPTAVNDYATFQTTDSPKTLNILANDIAGTGTLIDSSVVLFGGNASLFTNNLDGTVTLNTSTVGTYTTYYTVQSSIADPCPLTSNQATITVNVVPHLTTTTTTTSTTTSTTTVPTTTTTTSTTTSTTTVPTTTTTTTSTTTSTTTVPTTTTTTSTTTSTTTAPATTTTTTSTTTSTTTAAPSLYRKVYLNYGASEADACSVPAETFYLLAPNTSIAPGLTVYIDTSGTKYTGGGIAYIAESDYYNGSPTTHLYNYNDVTAVIGTDTGISC